MHRWNRTVLEWNFRGSSGLKTTLPVVGDPTGKIEKGKSQTLYALRAISLPERRGKIVVEMCPSVNLLNHAGEVHIFRRFTNLLGSERGVNVYRGTWGNGAWPPLSIGFKLDDGESFCDTAVGLAKAILAKAGVQDEHNYWLGHFTLKQDTFVKFENGWISSVRWLRIQHQLPLNYNDDDRNISPIEVGDLS